MIKQTIAFQSTLHVSIKGESHRRIIKYTAVQDNKIPSHWTVYITGLRYVLDINDVENTVQTQIKAELEEMNVEVSIITTNYIDHY